MVRVAGFTMAWLWSLAATLHAERAPLTPAQLVQESDLVVVGQIVALRVGTERSHVESGFGNYDWAIDLTLKIQRIEKGQLDRADTILVRCYRIKSRKSAWEFVSVSGNHPIPDVRAQVRAHLYRQGESWRVVFPNGLGPVSEQVALADAAAIRALSNRAFTYWLPAELWICIVVFAMFLLPILTFIRRSRRPHPGR
jgi:hypothetical protein